MPNLSKFMLSAANMEQVDIRCTVCGVSDTDYALRLTEAVEWAENHECPRTLTVN